MEINKNINGYQIYIGGTWCEVTKNGTHIFDGSVEEGTTAEEVYNWITKHDTVTGGIVSFIKEN